MKYTNDNLGNRMKSYEALSTNTMLISGVPVYCRIDGRAFHTFCKGLDKPFDMDMIKVMQNVCKHLVEKTNAILGYVQSDEISLGWEDISKAPFNGRLFKLTSVIASMTTTAFIMECMKYPKLKERVDKYFPSFDCRVCSVPNMTELANMFIWRENDAYKNAVSTIALAYCSHKELQNKNTKQKQEMYFQKTGKNFNDLDPVIKRGTYYRRVLVEKKLDEETLKKIPEYKRPKDNICIRTDVRKMNFPIMKNCPNKLETYFGKLPVISIKEAAIERLKSVGAVFNEDETQIISVKSM